MSTVRKEPPTKLKLRTETHLDAAGAYIAHSALRQMILKPMLLFYIVCRVWIKVYFYYNWIPLFLMCSTVLILPKLPIVRRDNWWKVCLEVLCAILQYSPEPITGSSRVYKSTRAHVTGISGWVPQFKVEQDFLIQPEVVATFSYQWKIFLVSCACLVPIFIFRPQDVLLQFLFSITAFLPIYTTLTALPYNCWKRFFRRLRFVFCCRCGRQFQRRRIQRLTRMYRNATKRSWFTAFRNRHFARRRQQKRRLLRHF